MSRLPQAGAGMGRCKAASGDEASMVVRKEEHKASGPARPARTEQPFWEVWIGLPSGTPW